MPAVKRTSSTLASENFSKDKISSIFSYWVAAFIFAATLVMFPAYAYSYSVKVEGLSNWQKEPAERSLNAVVQKLSSTSSRAAVAKILSAVSEQLFSGYKVNNIISNEDEVVVSFIPDSIFRNWSVKFEYPSLKSPAAEWFVADAEKALESITEVIYGVPVASLAWCDAALRNEIIGLLKPVLPGWHPTFIVYENADENVLKISFTAELPLVLALNPTFSSSSLPTLLHGELKEDILQEFPPFLGLPVSWAKLHTKDVNVWAEKFLDNRGIVERTASRSVADFSAAAVSQMNVNIESRRYSLGAWAAVYGGTKDRSAEIGLHIGRRVFLFDDAAVEAYGEGIVELKDWTPEGRLGRRCSPWGDVWIGGEWSSKDDMWWGRLNISPRLHKPYAWLRVREDGEINTAIGWKATQYISFELHFDSRDNDRWSLRMLGNL